MNELVELTLYNLEQLEQTGRPLPAREELKSRLIELAESRSVPVVVFNCLNPDWRPGSKRDYPKAAFSFNPETSICRYYQDYVAITLLALQDLGTPNLNIVIPDSELLDERVFSFAQSKEERIDTSLSAKSALSSVLTELDNPEQAVTLWSEYCAGQSLKTPFEYTTENYRRIQSDPGLQKKVQDQIKDSARFFDKKGVNFKKIDPRVIYERIAWYEAMYMGEGQALLESGAIVLNFEDSRIAAWFQRGADSKLPILTPVNANDFYAWRRKS
ncbi:MAG: hypothetical protein G01um10147_752 [Microgenomates group bacterium Gr01-1014_7]|nr:MAG: hypothetical protein G01um10147_752 [Microgenomates group bacterium Gr01-1014_7]